MSIKTLEEKFRELDNKNISELHRNFAKNMIELRNKGKMTQQKFAEKLHTTTDSIVAYENGDTLPNIDTALSIANIMNISVDDLITRDRHSEYKYGYSYKFLEAAGLEPLNALFLSELVNDEINRMIFNYMLGTGFINRFVELIKNNVIYASIYSEISNTNKTAAESIDDFIEYFKWKISNQLADDSIKISKEISKKMPKVLTKSVMKDIEDDKKNFDTLIKVIEEKIYLLKRYKVQD